MAAALIRALRIVFSASQLRLVAPIVIALAIFIALLTGYALHQRANLGSVQSQEKHAGELVGVLFHINTQLAANHNRVLTLINDVEAQPEKRYRESAAILEALNNLEGSLHRREDELVARLPYFHVFHDEMHNYMRQITSALELLTLSRDRAGEALRLATESMLRLHAIVAPGVEEFHRQSEQHSAQLLENLRRETLLFLAAALVLIVPLSAVAVVYVWRMTRAIVAPLNRLIETAGGEHRRAGYQWDVLQAMPLLERALDDLRNYRDNRLQVMQTALDNVPVAVQIVTLDHRIEYVNDTYLREHHANRREILGTPAAYLARATTEQRAVHDAVEARHPRSVEFRRGEDSWREIMVSMVRDANDKVLYAALLEVDISQQKKLEHELTALANNDVLTGLANRRQFNIRFAEEIERAQRYRNPLSLILLDIDHFKRVNDTWGHPVGDLVIRALAGLCRQAIRTTDLAARLGGEEFALLLPDTDLEGAHTLAERLREQAEKLPVANTGEAIRFTVSLGVGQWQAGENGDDLFLRSDEALYAAKDAGRNRVATARPAG